MVSPSLCGSLGKHSWCTENVMQGPHHLHSEPHPLAGNSISLGCALDSWHRLLSSSREKTNSAFLRCSLAWKCIVGWSLAQASLPLVASISDVPVASRWSCPRWRPWWSQWSRPSQAAWRQWKLWRRREWARLQGARRQSSQFLEARIGKTCFHFFQFFPCSQ